jgi:TPR repeat protein
MKTFSRGITVVAAAVWLASWQAPAAAEPEPAAPPQGQAAEPARSPLEMLVAAASSGNVDAMNGLAVLLTIGAQVPPDYPMALYWYQKAIDAGSADAMNNMGAMYLYGLGVQRDYANAFHWFERAGERGNVHGMYSAGAMAEAGLGTSHDPQLARTLFRKAAESGFVPAMVKVSDDCAQGSGARADPVEAYAWLQVAQQVGLPEELQITVLAKIDTLGDRLGAQRRDEGRARAVQLSASVREHLIAALREHAPPTQAGDRVAASRPSFM